MDCLRDSNISRFSGFIIRRIVAFGIGIGTMAQVSELGGEESRLLNDIYDS